MKFLIFLLKYTFSMPPDSSEELWASRPTILDASRPAIFDASRPAILEASRL